MNGNEMDSRVCKVELMEYVMVVKSTSCSARDLPDYYE